MRFLPLTLTCNLHLIATDIVSHAPTPLFRSPNWCTPPFLLFNPFKVCLREVVLNLPGEETFVPVRSNL